jgi:hypothetical protein
MRRAPYLAVLLLGALAVAGPAAYALPAKGERWRPGVQGAREYASNRAGTVSFAVRTRRHLYGHDSRMTMSSASVVKLFLEIERYVVRRHRDTVLRLLSSIVPRQRWGVARVIPRGWAFYFKGGWTSAVQHQVGLLRRGDRRIAIAVLTTGSPSASYGRETERGVALRLLRDLGHGSIPR